MGRISAALEIPARVDTIPFSVRKPKFGRGLLLNMARSIVIAPMQRKLTEKLRTSHIHEEQPGRSCLVHCEDSSLVEYMEDLVDMMHGT